MLEEQVGGMMRAQYVWSPVYVDALVLRDTASGSRLFAQQDANWNVTALVDATGAVQERYVYDPYGQATVLAPNWTGRPSSSVGWVYLHQGGRYDGAVGLYHFRHRDHSPALGRWLQQDPIGYADGMNLYGYVHNSPANLTDPTGEIAPLVAILVAGLITAVVGGTIGAVVGGIKCGWKGALEYGLKGTAIGFVAGVTGGAASWLMAGAIGGTGLGTALVAGMAGGAVGDVAGQTAEMALGWRDEYNVGQTLGATALAGAGGVIVRSLRGAPTTGTGRTPPAPTRTPVFRPGRAPEFPGGQVTESGFIRSAERWLGSGYREASPGRYVSADGMRQVRYGAHEVGGPRHHAHFEAYDRPGGHVIENTVVNVIPD